MFYAKSKIDKNGGHINDQKRKSNRTCGAVSGAVMLAGLKNSCKNLEQPASKADTYKLTREITKTFLEKNGSLTCGELKGTETGKVLRSCPDCIRDAVEIAESILEL